MYFSFSRRGNLINVSFILSPLETIRFEISTTSSVVLYSIIHFPVFRIRYSAFISCQFTSHSSVPDDVLTSLPPVQDGEGKKRSPRRSRNFIYLSISPFDNFQSHRVLLTSFAVDVFLSDISL